MRKIKFRIWNRKEKKMVYKLTLKKENLNLNVTFELYGDLVMQYTGLKDKNGKEIYEGDICKCRGDIFEKKIILEVVIFPKDYPDSIMLINESNHCRLYDVDNNIEVIGNIYENKEILKEVK